MTLIIAIAAAMLGATIGAVAMAIIAIGSRADEWDEQAVSQRRKQDVQ